MIVLGNLLLTVSTIGAMFPLALIARMISGIGMELQNVTEYAFIDIWFG